MTIRGFLAGSPTLAGMRRKKTRVRPTPGGVSRTSDLTARGGVDRIFRATEMMRSLLAKIVSRTLSAVGGQHHLPLPNIHGSQASRPPFRWFSSQTAQTSERFPCQHERRGELCKTLEKRNILDHKRRLLAAKYELRRRLYKAICRDADLPGEVRERHRRKLSRLPRNSALVRVRNRCVETGRARSVLRLFRMSRITFREKASQGALMGVKKSSW